MKKIFIILISFCFIAKSYAQIGINTTNTPPDVSAMLDINSTVKGVLIPRMTTLQKYNLPNKSDGLLVYDTDLKVFSYYKFYGGPLSGYWQDFGNPPIMPPSVWNTNGNDINNNNTGNVGINSGNLGVGTVTPLAKLDVNGDIIFRKNIITLFGSTYTNFDLNTNKFSIYELNLTHNFAPQITIHGFTGGVEGRLVTIINNGVKSLRLEHNSASSSGGNKINTGTGLSLTIPNAGIISMLYSNTDNMWHIVSTYNAGNIWSFHSGGSVNTPFNVGIGTNNTNSKLTIKQSTIESNNNTHVLALNGRNPLLAFNSETDNAIAYIKGVTDNTQTPQYPFGGLELGTIPGAYMYLSTGYEPRLIITDVGNVGIGNNNPINKLQIGNTPTYIGNDIAIGNGTQQMAIHQSPSVSVFYTNTNYAFMASGGTGNVGIGVSNPVNKLEVNGTIRAKEVIIETGWADYVFEENYKLKSIDELEIFVKENKHLPNIPSASEIESKGLKLGQTNKAMMEKIEELALYIIQLKKEIDILKSKN